MSGSRPGARPAVDEGCYSSSVMAFFIAMMGIFLQMLEFWLIGISLVLIAFWMVYYYEWMSEKSLYYKPSLNDRFKEWKPATINEYNKLVDKIDTVSNFNNNLLGRLTRFCSENSTVSFSSPTLAEDLGRFMQVILIGVIAILAALAGVGLFFVIASLVVEMAGLHGSDAETAFLVIAANTIVLVFSFGFVFMPGIWTPDIVSFKLPHFHKLMREFPAAGMGDWTTEFQLELCKTGEGQIPTDIKMVIKPPGAPAEFYGVQAQISRNMGGPYVYFVIVTKDCLKIQRPMGATTNDVVEPSRSDGVNILVIRNYATKTSGYITSPGDIRRLLQLTKNAALGTIG